MAEMDGQQQGDEDSALVQAPLDKLQELLDEKRSKLDMNSLKDLIVFAQMNSQILMHKEFPPAEHWFCDVHWQPYASATLIGLSCDDSIVAPLYYHISRQLSRCANCARIFHEEMTALKTRLREQLGVSRAIIDRFVRSVSDRHNKRLMTRLRNALASFDANPSSRLVNELMIPIYELLSAPDLLRENRELFAFFETALFKIKEFNPSLPTITRCFPGLIYLLFGDNTKTQLWAKSALTAALKAPLDPATCSALCEIFDSVCNFEHTPLYFINFLFNLNFFVSVCEVDWLLSHCDDNTLNVVSVVRHLLAQKPADYFKPLLLCFATLLQRLGTEAFTKALRLIPFEEVVDSIVANPAFASQISRDMSIRADSSYNESYVTIGPDLFKWIDYVFDENTIAETKDRRLYKAAQTVANIVLPISGDVTLLAGLKCLNWAMQLKIGEKLPLMSDVNQIMYNETNQIASRHRQAILQGLQSQNVEIENLTYKVVSQSIFFESVVAVRPATALSSEWSSSNSLWSGINFLSSRSIKSNLIATMLRSFKYLAFIHHIEKKVKKGQNGEASSPLETLGAIQLRDGILNAAVDTLRTFSELDPTKLQSITASSDCLEALFLCLFSSQKQLSQSAQDVMSQAYDVIGSRVDILRAVLNKDPSMGLRSITSAIRRVRTMSLFSPCVKLLTVCQDFLEALYGRNSVVDKAYTSQLSPDPEKDELYLYWKANWDFLGFTYKASRVWGGTYAFAVMKEFVRDEVDYCTSLLNRFRLFESDLAQQSGLESAKTGALLAGPTIASIESMCELLRLKDDALLHSCLRNILTIVDLMNSFKVPFPQSLIDTFVSYASQDIVNNLRVESIPEMLGPLNIFTESEIELIRLRAEAKKSGMKKDNLSDEQTDQPESLSSTSTATGAEKTFPSRPTFLPNGATPVKKLKIIDPAARQKAGIQSSLCEFLGKGSPTAPEPVKSTITVVQPAAPQRLSLMEAARASVTNNRKSTALAAAAAKPIPKEIHPPRPPGFNSKKQQPAQVLDAAPVVLDGADSSESSDSDEEGLFAVKAKTTALKPVIRNIDKPGKIGLMPRLNGPPKISNRELEERRMRARLNVDLSPLHKKVLTWNYHSSAKTPTEESNYAAVQPTYASVEAYQKVFFPLLLLECWQGIQKFKEEVGPSEKTFRLDIGRRVSCDEFIDVYASMELSDFNKIKIADSDLVLLTYEGKEDFVPKKPSGAKPHCLSKVKEVNTSSSSYVDITFRTYEPSGILPYLSQGQVLHGFKTMREYCSLMALEYYDLKNGILKGTVSPRINLRENEIQQTMHSFECNESQARAILGTTYSKGFSLIQGPPGTGKTKTILGIVGSYLASVSGIPSDTINGSKSTSGMKRLLICAPSNAAVDELVIRLKAGIKKGKATIIPKVVRLGRSDVVNSQVRDLTLEDLVEQSLKKVDEPADNGLRKQQNDLVQKRNDLREKFHNEQNLSTEEYEELDNKIRDLSKKIKETGRQLDLQREQRVVATRDREVVRRKRQMQILTESQVICSTLSGSAHSVLASLQMTFETVIIDEAAQSVELSALIPLKYGCRHCIMVGDPNQLPPTVISQVAQGLKYEKSLFVRMFDKQQSSVYMLDTQYRMHPEISEFPGQEFYDGKLKTPDIMREKCTRIWHRDSFKPFHFFSVKGRHTSGPQSRSLYNTAEAVVAYDIYQALIRNYPLIDFSGRIGIISPYKRQVLELKNIFAKHFGDIVLDQIDFNTVDGFQGQEKDIIIMSCVRAMSDSGGVGFLADTRRMNVALTRAKSSLWILGNGGSLVQNKSWSRLITNASKRKMFSQIRPGELTSYVVTDIDFKDSDSASSGSKRSGYSSKFQDSGPSPKVLVTKTTPPSTAAVAPANGSAGATVEYGGAPAIPNHTAAQFPNAAQSIFGFSSGPSSTSPSAVSTATPSPPPSTVSVPPACSTLSARAKLYSPSDPFPPPSAPSAPTGHSSSSSSSSSASSSLSPAPSSLGLVDRIGAKPGAPDRTDVRPSSRDTGALRDRFAPRNDRDRLRQTSLPDTGGTGHDHSGPPSPWNTSGPPRGRPYDYRDRSPPPRERTPNDYYPPRRRPPPVRGPSSDIDRGLRGALPPRSGVPPPWRPLPRRPPPPKGGSPPSSNESGRGRAPLWRN